MLEYVNAGSGVELWSAEEIREDSPEDAYRISDADRGVLFHSGDGHGALVIGTPGEIEEWLSGVIAAVRRRDQPIVDGEVVPVPAALSASAAETGDPHEGPCGECGAEAGEACRVPGCQGEWV